MLITLSQDKYHLIRPLFAGLEHHLIIEAVLIGNSPAEVYVDDADAPKTAFMKSPEGDFLVGAPDNPAFNQGMKDWIDANLINGKEEEIVFKSNSEAWEATIQEILAERPPLAYERYYYEISEVKLKPPALPAEFKLELVTSEFIARQDIKNMDEVLEQIDSNWTSRELFFEIGFGLVIVHEGEIVSKSIVDCVVGKRCEIGIFTNPDFQRRGLATALIAAVVEYAVGRGFNQIGWHCWVDNWGSIGVAQKVGLSQKLRYMAYISLKNAAINYMFKGFKRLQVQDYVNAEPEYINGMGCIDNESRPYLPRIYWEMARVQAGLGKIEAAFDAMRESLALGVKYSEKSLEVLEFAQFKENAEWNALFAKEKDS